MTQYLIRPPTPQITKTLERVLSKAGLGSRSEARAWIHARRVKVNGDVIENPDHWVYPQRDKILFDGRPLAAAEKRYILLHKPTGYITTYGDPLKRPTVYDLIQNVGTWVAPVGRLDLETSGLLILTNDTAFAERMTNPDFHVPKTYRIRTPGVLDDEQVEKLRRGVALSDGPTRPALVQRVPNGLEMTITEGRNRQVRRMLEAVDSKVVELSRTGIGRLRIGNLPLGKWREIKPTEI